MKTSDRGIAALVAHEGIVPAPYLDSVNVWTYGVGHTKSAGAPDPATMPRGMPQDMDAALKDVFDLFRKDLAKYEDAVRRAIRVEMEQHEFDAAVSFHFNTGAIARASWVRLWNSGDKERAAKAIMNWRKPAEIIGRREDEQRLFLTGEYPIKKAAVWRVTDGGRVVWRPERTLTQGEILDLMSPPKAKPANWLASLINAILSIFKR